MESKWTSGRRGRSTALGTRGRVLLGMLAAGLLAAWQLGLSPLQLVPSAQATGLLLDFFGRALTPALVYESPDIPPGAPPLLTSVLLAAGRTVLFALGGMTLALAIGAPLGLLTSERFWERQRGRWFARIALGCLRAVANLLRSVHELLFAVLFLAAVGLTPISAVLALALPYGGTLAKVFGEMLDEAPRDAADALLWLGASRGHGVLIGLLPRAIADMGAYGFYRLECALRSSAVLGFFGFETLGYGLREAFLNVQYGELWTHLWALVLLVVLVERWSGALRRRFVA